MSKIAIDIGGTNMRVATVHEGGLGPIARMRTPQDPHDALEELAALIQGTPEGIVCGFAGSIDESGAIRTATNLPEWDRFHLQQELARVTHAHVRVVNDAELAALGEAVYGSGKDAQTVAYIGLGTGIGTALVSGAVIETLTSEGEARASIISLADGSTLESLIGGHSVEQKYGKQPAFVPASVWKELAPSLAEGVANSMRLWSPDVIVLGGSLMNEETGFKLADVVREVKRIKKLPQPLPLIKKSALGDASGLYGARALLCS